MSTLDPSHLPVGGIDRHVGVARLRVADGPTVDTFSRGIGRNRVALLVTTPLELGDRVRFEVYVDGGKVSGVGHVDRICTQPVPGEEPEQWAVIDFEEVEPTGAAHLVRALFRSRSETALTDRVEARRRMGLPDELRPTHVKKPKPEPEPGRKRPRVERYAAPEAPNRWRIR